MRFEIRYRLALLCSCLVVGCGRTPLLEGTAPAPDAGRDQAVATKDALLPDLLLAECPPPGNEPCATGPRGRVVTSFGPGDCFAVATTGFVWPVMATSERRATAFFCGDIADLFGDAGPLRGDACGTVVSISTASCRQTGGGGASPPALYEWDFQCTLPDGTTCTTAAFFLDHGE